MKLAKTLSVLAAILAACAAFPVPADTDRPESDPSRTRALDASVKVSSTTPSRVVLPYSAVPKDPRLTITYTLVSGPSHGTIVMPDPHKKYSYQSGGYASYTSEAGYVGDDSFTWKLNDGYGNSETAKISITVAPSVPVPLPQATAHVVENGAVVVPARMQGGGGYNFKIVHSEPAHGTVELKGKTFHYKPTAAYHGTDSFTWHMIYGQGTADPTTPTESRTCWIVVTKAGVTDWPQWRADEWRSGFTSMELPARLHLQWRRDIPTTTGPFAARGPAVYPDVDYCRPVQLGKTLFVPVTACDRLSAYDTDTGALRWSFYASGAVRRPPAALKLPDGTDAVIFGSDDGWVYCLNAAAGSVRWRFRAAPNNRKAMGFGRISSVWPVWASPVISRGDVYFVAGYIPSSSLYGYCLGAGTGAVKWVNDGRITDMWNTSAFGPLAVSYDGAKVYGSVEGASRPWVLDSRTGEFLGHVGIGFEFSGSGNQRGRDTKSDGSCGWYVDGKGSFNIPEPMTITAGARTFDPESAKDLGVAGKVASLLAGDGKLFVTTAEGGIYCFGGKEGEATVYPHKTTPLPDVSDEWTAAAKAMLSREDLKQGLALVLGVGSGRLAEELARQSSLMIVAVDPDHGKLQALRARMDAAGFSAERVSTLQGSPMDFSFAPCQAALIVSEDAELAGLAGGRGTVERLYGYTRPFGGEVWLPTSSAQHEAFAGFHGKSGKVPLSEVTRTGGFTRIIRKGLPDEALRIQPPFGLVAFGSEGIIAPYLPLTTVWRNQDAYSWLPLTANGPGRVPPAPNSEKGYPTASTVSTSESVFSSMRNPLFGTMEKFPGLPSSGNDGSCSATYNRYGDIGLTHGKISSVFDTSSRYWGRLFFPEAGGCPGRMVVWDGVLVNTAMPVPGSTCGCSPAMQFTTFALAPMEGEESWVNYQTVRTGNAVEELPISRVGVNFGAPGDRYEQEDRTLWTHHPYSGRYGRCSYNFESVIEAFPLVPVSYSGDVKSVYHHSAQMREASDCRRGWVSASYVKGMTGIAVPLAQPAVAIRTASAPKVDGALDDACWQGQARLTFAVNKVIVDRDRKTGLPKADEQCYAMLRYDDQNLYVATGVHAEYGPPISGRPDSRRSMTVALNSRERVAADLVLTGTETVDKGQTKLTRESTGIDSNAWSYAGGETGKDPYTAEMAIPWKEIAAAGLWKDQLVINIRISGGDLVARYTPLYLDKARGVAAEARPYTVRLYFAEMEGLSPGRRVFDVSLQGRTVLAGLDVVKEAGGERRELVREFENMSIADELRIGFVPKAGEPMLSGVEIVGTYAQKDLAPNAAPTAAIAADVLAGPAPLAVTFDARQSSDPDGQVVQCAWDTGDGRLARGSLLQHVYAEPGTYTMHLLVRDNRGAMAAKALTVVVTPGKPAAFVCAIRADGGDYGRLSAWESAMRSDLVSAAGSSEHADPGIAPGKALLFRVKGRGKYAATDDGKPVTFTGGGTGRLRHINGEGLAYITDCHGSIQPGEVTCASGNSFDVADSGNPPYVIIAECYNDWPDGLPDSIEAPAAGEGWTTDPLHCVVIRAAAGHGHTGKLRDAQAKFTGFALKGDLDAGAIPHLRLSRLIIDPASKLTLGAGASVNRVVAGAVRMNEGGMAANCVATTFSAGNSANFLIRSVSSYTVDLRDGRNQARPPKLADSGIGFYNCTAQTFDPGNQVAVQFVNCLAAAGGEGFLDAGYCEPALAFHCVSTDGTATRWDPGEADGDNATGQPVEFVNAAAGDFHLAPSDSGARNRGGPALGADIDGQPRTGPHYHAGADGVAEK